MQQDRRNILKRISDGFLPPEIIDKLYVDYFVYEPIRINGWSFIHALSGFMIKRMGYNIEKANMIHVYWEGFQFMIGDNDITKLEEWVDIGMDTIFFNIGYKI